MCVLICDIDLGNILQIPYCLTASSPLYRKCSQSNATTNLVVFTQWFDMESGKVAALLRPCRRRFDANLYTAGQNGFGTSGPQGNGDQEEEEQAQPEEPVSSLPVAGLLHLCHVNTWWCIG